MVILRLLTHAVAGDYDDDQQLAMQWLELYCLSPEHSVFLSEPLSNFSLAQHILGAALVQACKKHSLETSGWDCRLLKDAVSTAPNTLALHSANGLLLLLNLKEMDRKWPCFKVLIKKVLSTVIKPYSIETVFYENVILRSNKRVLFTDALNYMLYLGPKDRELIVTYVSYKYLNTILHVNV